MNSSNSHSIQKVFVEVNTATLKTGNYVKNNFSAYFNATLLPLLEEKLNNINSKTGHYDIRLEELSLAIDLKELEDFSSLENKIIPTIEKQINTRIANKLLGSSEKEIVVKDTQSNQEEIVKAFVTTGKFPWWFSENQFALETIALEKYIHVRELENETFRTRLIHQFQDIQLLALLESKLHNISDKTVQHKITTTVALLYSHINAHKNEQFKDRTAFWNAIFLLVTKASTATFTNENLEELIKKHTLKSPLFDTVLEISNEESSSKIDEFKIEDVTKFTPKNKATAQQKAFDYDNQFNKLKEQFAKILRWFAFINSNTIVVAKEINDIALQLQKVLSEFESDQEKKQYKAQQKVDNKAIFSVQEMMQLIENAISFQSQNSSKETNHKTNSFYKIVPLLTTLRNEIQHSETLKQAIYNSTTTIVLQEEFQKTIQQYSKIATSLHTVKDKTVIVGKEVKSLLLMLLNSLSSIATNISFTEKCNDLKNAFAQQESLTITSVIRVTILLQQLKNEEAISFSSDKSLSFYKVLLVLNQLKQQLAKASLLVIDEVEINKDAQQEFNKHKVALDEFFISEKGLNQEEEKVKTERNIEALALEQISYVNNAGLILIHPFLKFFFINIGLYNKEEKKLIHPAKAAHLLYYIATKKENAFEHEMTFEKILCGIPLSESISRFISITPKEKEEAENMLKAMLSNWEKMENSSPDLLRHEYLQRQGKLIVKDNKATLTIAYKTQDILLNKLNWNISLIKLPWLDSILTVEWC